MLSRKLQGEKPRSILFMTKKVTVLFATIFFFHLVANCQARVITGKIIDENFVPVWGASIFTSDTILLCKTDSVGNFRLDLPSSTSSIRIAAVGLEWKIIKLRNECSQVDIVLLNNSSYDFMTLQEVDRLRKKEFKKLPKLHAKAFEQGIFTTQKPCYGDIFISDAEREY